MGKPPQFFTELKGCLTFPRKETRVRGLALTVMLGLDRRNFTAARKAELGKGENKQDGDSGTA